MIPFIGAGFSSVFNLPGWRSLLEGLAETLQDDLTFEEVDRFAQGDLLQIAEYYFLKSGRQIGPMRHEISRKLVTTSVQPVASGQHVDLVNLGAPRVYTTNYDDLIELTYKQLGVPHEVVALPRDMATSVGALRR